MAISKSYNNLTFSIPEAGEVGWSDLTFFLTELADAGQTIGKQFGATRTATTTPQNLSATTDHILIMNVASASTVNLPSGQVGQRFIVQDGSGAAATNNITIVPAVGQTIDGNASVAITNNNSSVEVVFAGSNTWRVIGSSTISAPTFTSVTITGLTANQLVATDASKTLVSVATISSPLAYDSGTTTLSIDLTDYITNAMVNTSAGIAWSKMAVLPDSYILVGSSGNVATPRAVSGAISISNLGSTTYQGALQTVPVPTGAMDFNSQLLNNVADPVSAQDAATKAYVDSVASSQDELGELSDVNITTPSGGDLLIYDGTDSWDNQTVSGDVTISSTGVTSISSGVIVDADVNASAAITWSKLATGTTNRVVITDPSGYLTTEAALDEIRGGTGKTTYTQGDILYADTTTTLASLAIGTANYVMVSSGTAPTWTNNLTLNDLTITGTVDLAAAGFDDGSAGSPSIYFNDQTSLGIYRIGNHQMGFASQGLKTASISEWAFNLWSSVDVADNEGTINFYKKRGSATGHAIDTGDVIGSIDFNGAYDASNYNYVGGIRVEATEDYSTTSTRGSKMIFETYDTATGTDTDTLVLQGGSATFNSSLTVTGLGFFADGTVGAPSISFTSDTDTGLWKSAANTLNISAGGSEILEVDGTSVDSTVPILVPDGAVGAPTFAFTSTPSTGMYRGPGGQLSLAHTGTAKFYIDSTYNYSVNIHAFADGTAAGPGLTFISDANTGFHLNGGTLGAGVGGSTKFSMNATYNQHQNIVLFETGSAAAPSLAFTSDTDTGFYSPTLNQVGVTAAGAQVAEFSATQFQTVSGSSSAPAISFLADTDTGMYYYTSASFVGVGFSSGGSLMATIEAASGLSNWSGRLRLHNDNGEYVGWTIDNNPASGVSYDMEIPNTAPSVGQVLQVASYIGGKATMSWGTVTTSTFGNLTDVTLTSPIDTSFVLYDTGSGDWIDQSINDLTTDASPDDAADYLMTYDASAGIHKKILLSAVSGTLGGSGTTNTIPKWTSSTDIGDSIMTENSGDIDIAGGFQANNSGGHLLYYKTDNELIGKYASATGDGFRYVGQYGTSAVASTRELVTLDGQAHDGTDWYTTGEITIFSSGTQSASNHGGYIEFKVVDAGTTTLDTKVTIIGDQIRSQDGVTGGPAYSFSGDTDTGMWRSAADSLNFSTGGIERLEINNSNLVIGNGAYTIPLTDGSANQVLQTNGSGTASWQTLTESDISDLQSYLLNVVEDTTPQLGGDLDANGNDIILAAGAVSTPSLYFTGDSDTGMWSSAANTIDFSTQGTARFQITSSYIQIGQGFSAYQLPLTDGTSGQVLSTDGAGNVTWGSAGSGDVTAAANITDHTIVRGNGGAKGVQDTGITIDDNDNLEMDGKLSVNNMTPTYATGYTPLSKPNLRIDRQITSGDANTTTGALIYTENNGTAPSSWINFAAVITAGDNASRSTAATYNVGVFGESFIKGSGSLTYHEGLRFANYVQGSGTVTQSNAINVTIGTNAGTRNVTDARLLYLRNGVWNHTGGAVTNLKGIYLEAQTGSGTVINKHAIYEDWGAFGASNYWTSPHQSGDGSASAPTYSFNGDTNTGFFRKASDEIGVALGGTERLYFDEADNHVRVNVKNAANSTGYYCINDTLLTHSGTSYGCQFYINSNQTAGSASAGTFATINYNTNTGTMKGVLNQVTLEGGTLTASVGNESHLRGRGGISTTHKAYHATSSVSTGGGTATTYYGLHIDNAGSLTYTNKYGVYEDLGSGTINYWSGIHHAASGSASAPTYSFSADTDVGMYYDSALRFAVVGAEKFRMTGSYNYSAQTLYVVDGSSSAPGIASISDTNTGVFFPAADEVGIAVGGAECARFKDFGTGTYGIDLGNSGEGFYESGGHLYFTTGAGSPRGYVGSTGGLVWGSPTGGDKGAGAINAEAVYDDNSLLTDYVFEAYYTGKPFEAKHANYTMMSLEQEIEHTQEKYHLSTMVGRKEWEAEGPKSTGQLINQLWETVETQFLYIKELKEELDELKKKLN